MTSTLRCSTRFAAVFFSLLLSAARAAPPFNVLFIAVDDLRAELGCYGSPIVKTPQLDALARRGMLFERAYCQQAVCNASRASFLTGRRPDSIKVWDLVHHFRETVPDIVTLPQHFKNHGYVSLDFGKVYHNEAGGRAPPFPFEDPLSWSAPPVHAVGAHWRDWVVPGSQRGPDKKQGPVQCLDVPDNAYWDGQIAEEACAALRKFHETKERFFLAVGFWKPHLPFNAPKKYWDLYDRAKLPQPDPAKMPVGAPAIASHPSRELRGYAGMSAEGRFSDAQIMELRHGYFASISFVDAQVGKVIAELDRQGVAGNTVIVFLSDHGYHVGEHELWCKTSNYELDTRVPLLIAAPGLKGNQRTSALVELLDLYPTLVDLCQLPAVAGLEGENLVPVLRQPTSPGKVVAVSQHPHPSYTPATHMGYALRAAQYRYVEWRRITDGVVTDRELYDEAIDPKETSNFAGNDKYAAIERDLAARCAELVARGGRWKAK